MTTEKRLIDANDPIEKILLECNAYSQTSELTFAGLTIAKKIVEAAPTVDAVEVVHGQWVFEPIEFTYEKDIKCSVCGEYADHTTNYCPNCGAKMDGGKDDGN